MITPIDKAIVALIVGAVVLALTHFHVGASDDLTAAIGTIVTTVVVYLVPNKT